MRHPGPLILAIETSNPTAEPGASASVALARPDPSGALEPLAVVHLGPDESTGLLPSIDRCFTRAGLTPDALRSTGARIALSIGPGGYTSVRIAVTSAKLLAEATGALCVPVPTAHVVALSIPDHAIQDAPGVPRPFAVALASKRDTAWLTLFNADRSERRTLGLVDDGVIDTLASEGAATLIIDRFAPPLMLERARAASIRIVPPVFDPLACARLAIARDPVDPLELAPLYPREPEAVTKWRALKDRR